MPKVASIAEVSETATKRAAIKTVSFDLKKVGRIAVRKVFENGCLSWFRCESFENNLKNWKALMSQLWLMSSQMSKCLHITRDLKTLWAEAWRFVLESCLRLLDSWC